MIEYPKYIIYRGHMDMEEFVIFPNYITHPNMAFRMDIRAKLVISAGFVNNWFECFGKSISLKVESRGDIDTALLRKAFVYQPMRIQ